MDAKSPRILPEPPTALNSELDELVLFEVPKRFEVPIKLLIESAISYLRV